MSNQFHNLIRKRNSAVFFCCNINILECPVYEFWRIMHVVHNSYQEACHRIHVKQLCWWPLQCEWLGTQHLPFWTNTHLSLHYSSTVISRHWPVIEAHPSLTFQNDLLWNTHTVQCTTTHKKVNDQYVTSTKPTMNNKCK